MLAGEHRFFVDEETDNSEHVPRIARIAESVRRTVERNGCDGAEADRARRELVEFGRALFDERAPQKGNGRKPPAVSGGPLEGSPQSHCEYTHSIISAAASSSSVTSTSSYSTPLASSSALALAQYGHHSMLYRYSHRQTHPAGRGPRNGLCPD